MKLSNISPGWKFLAGLAVYAAVVWFLSRLPDYRDSIFGIFVLSAITFAMALWALVRNKKAITIILIAALSAAPVRAGDEPADGDAVAGLIIGCGVLIVGGVIIYGLYKLCKKIPGPPNTSRRPPATNAPPDEVTYFNTNSPAALIMPGEAALTEYDAWDTVVIQFQTKTATADWEPAYTITNWFSNARFVSVMYSNSLALKTNFGSCNWSNGTMVSDFSSVMPTQEKGALRLWRAVQIQ